MHSYQLSNSNKFSLFLFVAILLKYWIIILNSSINNLKLLAISDCFIPLSPSTTQARCLLKLQNHVHDDRCQGSILFNLPYEYCFSLAYRYFSSIILLCHSQQYHFSLVQQVKPKNIDSCPHRRIHGRIKLYSISWNNQKSFLYALAFSKSTCLFDSFRRIILHLTTCHVM